ncbi:Activity-regulated cytoskeleton associated protein 1 [Carabus blaptoides fortunei]
METAHTQAAKRLERGQAAILDLQSSVRDGLIALKGLLDELRRNMETEKHTINTFCQGMQEPMAKTHAAMIMEVQRHVLSAVPLDSLVCYRSLSFALGSEYSKDSGVQKNWCTLNVKNIVYCQNKMPPKKEDSSTQNIVLTEEQFSALLSQIRGQPHRDITSPVTTQGCGSFVKCTARFNGDENSDVDAFIDAIQTYKECSNISEDNALRGLSMLFEGLAATWWQGIKATVINWDSAINTLKDVYSRKLPPHLIYRKVFEQEQNIGEATELFVCNIRALFAQLPYTLSEEAQLDMVYGLLNRKVRKRMPRKDFKTFKEMLNLARSIEQAVQEMNVTHPPSEKKTSGEKPKEMKSKCAYCKAYGHSKEECRKLNKREDKSTRPGTNKTTLVCFGCGTPGYIRAKCPTCSQKKTSEAKVDAISFYSVSAANTDLKRRPLIPITIAGTQGVAFADSGAQVNLASATLYELLRKTNHVFTEAKVNLSFADGRSRGKTVLETKTDVQIQDRIIETTFIVLPEVQDNNTLLGTQFLKEAKIVLNFGENNWFFSDEGDKSYEFVNEDVLPRNQQLFEVREQNLRVDEGSELTSRETQELNTLLNAHEDIFRLGGAPTTFAVHEINTGDHRPISTPPYPIHGQLEAKKKIELNQDKSKFYADKSRGACTFYKSKDLVLLKTHPISSTTKGVAAKLMPRRDGPYEIDKVVSPTTYILSDPHTNRKVGKYHVSDLTPFFGRTEEIPEPTVPKRQRGRPRKLLSSSRGRQTEARGGEV